MNRGGEQTRLTNTVRMEFCGSEEAGRESGMRKMFLDEKQMEYVAPGLITCRIEDD
jgi:hypothetical protein